MVLAYLIYVVVGYAIGIVFYLAGDHTGEGFIDAVTAWVIIVIGWPYWLFRVWKRRRQRRERPVN